MINNTRHSTLIQESSLGPSEVAQTHMKLDVYQYVVAPGVFGIRFIPQEDQCNEQNFRISDNTRSSTSPTLQRIPNFTIH